MATMKMKVNLNDHCRLCSKTGVQLLSPNMKLLEPSKGLVETNARRVCDLVHSYLQIEVSEDLEDLMPRNVCSTCTSKILQWESFVEMCRNSHNYFQSVLSKDFDLPNDNDELVAWMKNRRTDDLFIGSQKLEISDMQNISFNPAIVQTFSQDFNKLSEISQQYNTPIKIIKVPDNTIINQVIRRKKNAAIALNKPQEHQDINHSKQRTNDGFMKLVNRNNKVTSCWEENKMKSLMSPALREEMNNNAQNATQSLPNQTKLHTEQRDDLCDDLDPTTLPDGSTSWVYRLQKNEIIYVLESYKLSTEGNTHMLRSRLCDHLKALQCTEDIEENSKHDDRSDLITETGNDYRECDTVEETNEKLPYSVIREHNYAKLMDLSTPDRLQLLSRERSNPSWVYSLDRDELIDLLRTHKLKTWGNLYLLKSRLFKYLQGSSKGNKAKMKVKPVHTKCVMSEDDSSSTTSTASEREEKGPDRELPTGSGVLPTIATPNVDNTEEFEAVDEFPAIKKEPASPQASDDMMDDAYLDPDLEEFLCRREYIKKEPVERINQTDSCSSSGESKWIENVKGKRSAKGKQLYCSEDDEEEIGNVNENVEGKMGAKGKQLYCSEDDEEEIGNVNENACFENNKTICPGVRQNSNENSCSREENDHREVKTEVENHSTVKDSVDTSRMYKCIVLVEKLTSQQVLSLSRSCKLKKQKKKRKWYK